MKDELIVLTSKEARKAGIEGKMFRLVTVYKADENKVIQVITNQLDWQARTVADLYKKRWDIEICGNDCLPATGINTQGVL